MCGFAASTSQAVQVAEIASVTLGRNMMPGATQSNVLTRVGRLAAFVTGVLSISLLPWLWFITKRYEPVTNLAIGPRMDMSPQPSYSYLEFLNLLMQPPEPPPPNSGLASSDDISWFGRVRAPAQVYVGTSTLVTVQLDQPSFWILKNFVDAMPQDIAERIRISLSENATISSVAVELRAAGVTLAGDAQQSRLIQSGTPVSFTWNCHFDNSGDYIMTFVVRGVATSGRSFEVATFRRDVRVVRVDHLTDRQVWLFGSVFAAFGVISSLLGIVKTLREGTLSSNGPAEPGPLIKLP